MSSISLTIQHGGNTILEIVTFTIQRRYGGLLHYLHTNVAISILHNIMGFPKGQYSTVQWPIKGVTNVRNATA